MELVKIFDKIEVFLVFFRVFRTHFTDFFLYKNDLIV